MIRAILAAACGSIAMVAIALVVCGWGRLLILFVEPSEIRMHASHAIETPDPRPEIPDVEWGNWTPSVDFESALLDVRVHDYISGPEQAVEWHGFGQRPADEDWSRMVRARASVWLPVAVSVGAFALFFLAGRLRWTGALLRPVAALAGMFTAGIAVPCLVAGWVGEFKPIVVESGIVRYLDTSTVLLPQNQASPGSSSFELGPVSYKVTTDSRSWITFGEQMKRRPRRTWVQTTRMNVTIWPLALVFSAYPLAWALTGPVRRWRRRKRGLCEACGYDLTGNVTGVCPECAGKVSGR